MDDSQKTWLLQNGTATIMPSRGWEGFPLVFVETFAAGKPLVASAIPGLDAAVEHGETGLLVAPDAPVELADAMARLVGDDEPGAATRRCRPAKGRAVRLPARRRTAPGTLRRAAGRQAPRTSGLGLARTGAAKTI